MLAGMTVIALFHANLGVRPGIIDAADRLRTDGHRVLIVDQYDGRVFTDFEEANRFVEQIGFPELMRRALEAVQTCRTGFSPPVSPTAVVWPSTSPPNGPAAAS